eukprot:56065_1
MEYWPETQTQWATNHTCFLRCASDQYTYFALEAWGTCWCSNSYASAIQHGPSTLCPRASRLGGGWAMDLYNITNYTGTFAPTQQPTLGPITMTVSGSPYNINQDIMFNGATIENGVEIIFEGDYVLSFNGAVDAGCSGYTLTLSNGLSQGLLNTNTFIYIHPNYNNANLNFSQGIGSIDLSQTQG